MRVDLLRAAASRTDTLFASPLQVEFPPLLTLSGSKRKSQFDDFDNISELDANKDFAIELMTLNREALQRGKDCWLLFPDLKELETSASEWVGEKFSKVTRTTIEAATECITGGQFVKPWGSQFVSAVSSMINDPEKTTSTLLGDTSYLDEISSTKPPMLSIAVQPGNGGPVEVRACKARSGKLERASLRSLTLGACTLVRNVAAASFDAVSDIVSTFLLAARFARRRTG